MISEHHQERFDAIGREWRELGMRGIEIGGGAPTLANAEVLTMSKSRVELPVVERAKLGASPTSVAIDSELWSQIGSTLLAMRGLERSADDVLDAQSIALLQALRPVDWSTSEPLDDAGLRALRSEFARSIVADSALNLTRMRMTIHAELRHRARSGAGARLRRGERVAVHRRCS